MPAKIAILISSYQRPRHLERVLASVAAQRDVVPNDLEVVVTDDGSTDDSSRVVQDFAKAVPFRVAWTTHLHDGFQLAKCRNEGVAASRAPYLLFLDGDCLIPPDHIAQHLRHRRADGVMAGYCCLLSREQSESLSLEDIRRGRFIELASAAEHTKLRRMDRKARLYQWLRHPAKPKLFGGNVGISREHYLRVNGYDENFVGWGCEDDDLRLRLRASRIRIYSILRWTRTYHLWHPVGETTPSVWSEGHNVSYLNRANRAAWASNGVDKYLAGQQLIDATHWNALVARAS